uniref:2-oxo acid dehydrogenase subunit E2 n=1 Tax=Staphylococcus warneri TaxID=1292 RepID=UPI001643516C
TQYHDLHLALPTSLQHALILPLITQPHTKTLPPLPNQIKHSSQPLPEAKTNHLQLQPPTFTITNIPSTQIQYFTPILNLPETAILPIPPLPQQL